MEHRDVDPPDSGDAPPGQPVDDFEAWRARREQEGPQQKPPPEGDDEAPVEVYRPTHMGSKSPRFEYRPPKHVETTPARVLRYLRVGAVAVTVVLESALLASMLLTGEVREELAQEPLYMVFGIGGLICLIGLGVKYVLQGGRLTAWQEDWFRTLLSTSTGDAEGDLDQAGNCLVAGYVVVLVVLVYIYFSRAS